VLAAADFFTVEVWGPRGLVTFYVFFLIELATRRIERLCRAVCQIDQGRMPQSDDLLRGTVASEGDS